MDAGAAVAADVEAQTIPTVTFKKRSAKGKHALRKRPQHHRPASDSESSGYSSFEDDNGQRVKRRRRNGGIVADSTNANTHALDLETTKYTGDRSAEIDVSNDATKQSNWYDEENDNNKLDSKPLRQETPATLTADTANDGTYKGTANYRSFIEKKPDAFTRQVGPIKASTNIRTITTTDFAPDVCKDYKLTGFCGFGDSCKFLHAREDYKQGWELDREWEINTKGKKVTGGVVMASAGRNTKATGDEDDEYEEAMLENIPFACIICKESYKNPIITKCGHYFCEACALRRYRKTPSCAACGSGTGGVFNQAKKLSKLLERKRQRAEKQREEEDDDEDDDSDDA